MQEICALILVGFFGILALVGYVRYEHEICPFVMERK